MTEAEIVRLAHFSFPMSCPTVAGHVHVRDVGRGPTVCLSLEQLASVARVVDEFVERVMAA